MNPVIEQIYKIFKELPLSRKIAIGLVILAMAAGFTAMFIWANKTEYKPAYTELNEDDAAAVVAKIKELKIPYKIMGGGSIIMVPATKVYDVRLDLAKDGIPKGSGVGYEIFDKTDFGTSEFVQKINRKRAIQGELARTISAFDEVKTAKVMIVLPKDSVFVEETKLPSASILLELKNDIDEEKVSAIAHLVASSIQDLTPKRITIVDTAGRILFEGKSEEEKARIKAKNLADAQYNYKVRFEANMADRIQTMLERIVGKDKAIVRVTAEMDFSTNNVKEDIYDPFERETKFIRSEKNLSEASTIPVQQQGTPSSVNPVVPKGGGAAGANSMEKINKKNDTINYELSRRTSQTVKPMAVLSRLSVAAVVDGEYQYKTDKDGNRVRTYVPRSKAEMQQFSDLVTKAMGYNQSRQDQVSMECFPFASIGEIGKPEKKLTGWRMVQKEYGRTIANILLVLLIFLLVIMPIMKTVKGIKSGTDQEALPGPDELDLIEDKEEEPEFTDMSAEEQKEFLESMPVKEKEEFINNMSHAQKTVYLANLAPSEKAAFHAKNDVDKTANIIKGWISEVNEEEEEDK